MIIAMEDQEDHVIAAKVVTGCDRDLFSDRNFIPVVES